GVLGALPGRRRQLLPGRRLPGPADLEPPVVRGLPVGVHRRGLAAGAPGAAHARSRGRAPGQAAGIRTRPAAVAGAAARPRPPGAGRPLRIDPRPGQRLVQPRAVLHRVPARLPGGARRAGMECLRTDALAGTGGVAAGLAGDRGVSRSVPRAGGAEGATPADARGLGAGPVVRDRRHPRLRTPPRPWRQPRAALPVAGDLPGLHPAPDDHRGARLAVAALPAAAAAGGTAAGGADVRTGVRRVRADPARGTAATAVRAQVPGWGQPV